ncbi:hypothetical protein [Chitinophaga sp.]|uniref:hypothetical protein n=1 Tax=Chitinophaga sp. TaxID=1869181 RepID=UPI002604FD5D|nr:hypothetical protein [uncultured Chitinophaga sp.]
MPRVQPFSGANAAMLTGDVIFTSAIMSDTSNTSNQVIYVTNFQELVGTPYQGDKNAVCWKREPMGDFAEIIQKVPLTGNITVVEETELRALQLSEQGQIARDTLLQDLQDLRDHGAAPVLNIIKNYDEDDGFPFFPTDVYSYHVDRSPVPTDTILCTYYGDSSEILPNAQVKQKILIPEIRAELRKLYDGDDAGFEAFLTDNFFDLHYQAEPGAQPLTLGNGHLWRLAVDHPGSDVLPCVHRAPKEKSGLYRLLLIC